MGIDKLPAFFEKSKLVIIVIETPKWAAFKVAYDGESGVYRAHKALPLGLAFPFDFGFLPSTQGADGDPLDVLLLTGHTFPVGAVVLGELLSVLEAEQTEEGKPMRNDRLIAIPVEETTRKPMPPIVRFDAALKRAIVDFFVHYNRLQGKGFRAIRYAPVAKAFQAVRKHIRRRPDR